MKKEEVQYRKNDVIEFDIIDYGNEGEGIGKTDAFTWFIKDTVIGDRVRASVMKLKKNYGYARLLEVIKPSRDRVEPPCKVARACGGCTLQASSYKSQLRFKENKVLSSLERIGGFSRESYEYDGIIGMEEPFRYRNKAIFPVGKNKAGEVISGFYANHSHTIIENDDCLLGVKENKQILDIVLDFIRKFRIEVYDEDSHNGLVRNILIRKGFHTAELMVCIIINGDRLSHTSELVEALLSVEGMTSISLNINKAKTNVIMGKEMINLYGNGYIEDYIGDIKFRISPLSFYQVNPEQTFKLYSKALEYANLSGNEVVWDLYCGIGSISLFLARSARQVYGIEIIKEATDDAIENARINGIDNASFYVGEAEKVLPKLYGDFESGKDKSGDNKGDKIDGGSVSKVSDISDKEVVNKFAPDVMVVDPPRKGCDKLCLDTMIKMNPERIVYVSCDCATLARDARYLCENGYGLRRVCVVDQFGHTGHVETVALLSKLDVDKHIDVEIKLDELDLTSAESKASYAQIKEYILEKFDLKVSTLYIAQVRRKYGLDIREHYNISNNESQKIPQCSIEKEEVILDALKHFKML